MIKHDTAKTPAESLHELEQLVAQARLMVNAGTEGPAGTVDSLRERLGAARERLGESCAAARKKVVAGATATDATIRENPYASLAIALGVGVLVGLLVGRGRE